MADAVHQQLSQTDGAVPVTRVAKALGVFEIEVQPFDGFEGMLLTDARRSVGSILANNTNGDRRARFTIAHELGHFLLERHVLNGDDGFQCRSADLRAADPRSDDRHKRQEAEANLFAAHLLAPLHLFDRHMQPDPSLNDAARSALALDISLEVALRRMIDLRDELLAAIWSINGTIRYSIKHKDFPFLVPRRTDQLPKDTLAARQVAARRTGTSKMLDAPPRRWVDRDNYELFEQIRLGRGGHAVTLLWAKQHPNAGEDEEDGTGGLDGLTVPTFR